MKPERLVPHGRDKRKLNFNDLVRGVRTKDMGCVLELGQKVKKEMRKIALITE